MNFIKHKNNLLNHIILDLLKYEQNQEERARKKFLGLLRTE